MIAITKRCLERRKILAEQAEYDAGYDYAAGVLLRTQCDIKPSWDIVDDGVNSAFDRGILSAERDMHILLELTRE